ncbi:MAG: ribosome biogenesis GTP-binding protein YihA/YsxC [Parasphingopyxis sp.]|jgi:GTP-binding protein|uniref:ribosome biogenesis GTP-binding protein YihA/YsxC n=1 Tax=Parasphingopyxis sp. TaxID=1920299 RepID=UPI003FA0AF9C
MTDQAALEEMARKTFSGPIDFLKSAPSLEFLPDADLPEVAFAGRSNVGKSTLLNALTNRKGLARASNTPGRTQELNFFEVGDPPQFRLVDMPGYGFAKAPPQVAKRWRHLINDFLRGRPTLKRTLLLVDARRGLKDIDRELMEMLDEAAVSYRIVLTKSDKLKDKALAATTATLAEQAKGHAAAHPDILATSSETGLGVDELRKAVIQAIG